MAQSDRRSTPKDSVDTDADDVADTEADDVARDGDATVSETGSLSKEPAGDSDAPDDGPHPTADVAATDPRSSATAGAEADSVPESTESSGSKVVPSTSPKAKTGKGKAKPGTTKTKSGTTKTKTGKTEDTEASEARSTAKGKASKSGDPARKKAAAEEKKPAKVSRTPVKPKRLANRWAAPMMLACAGIGLAWIVVFYVTQDRIDIPWYSDLGSWNLVVGMGFIVAAFGFSMKWE